MSSLLFVYFTSVWKEWIIVNNTFEAMLLANGDMCPGEKPRQTKVTCQQLTDETANW